jgi:hypothetical protein
MGPQGHGGDGGEGGGRGWKEDKEEAGGGLRVARGLTRTTCRDPYRSRRRVRYVHDKQHVENVLSHGGELPRGHQQNLHCRCRGVGGGGVVPCGRRGEGRRHTPHTTHGADCPATTRHTPVSHTNTLSPYDPRTILLEVLVLLVLFNVVQPQHGLGVVRTNIDSQGLSPHLLQGQGLQCREGEGQGHRGRGPWW